MKIKFSDLNQELPHPGLESVLLLDDEQLARANRGRQQLDGATQAAALRVVLLGDHVLQHIELALI